MSDIRKLVSDHIGALAMVNLELQARNDALAAENDSLKAQVGDLTERIKAHEAPTE